MVSANIPAELPHLNVFTVQVNDPLNPDADTLVHVSTVTELSTVPIGRPAGIAAPGPAGTLYLSNVWSATYGDLQTALDAATAFQQNVNALVTAWISFEANYTAPDATPAYYTFPAPDTSTVTVLIQAYTTAKQARYQTQLTAQAATTTLTAAQNDYTYKSALLTTAQTLLGDVTALYGSFSALLSAGNVFYNANTGGTGAAAFLASLTTATGQLSSSPAMADATAANTARTADAAMSATALATATSNQASTAQALTAAQALEASTLAAVLAVCPNFDPHSVPLLPG
jgi:hypothetical protein